MMGVNVYPNDGELPEHFRHDRVAALIVSPAKAKTLKDSDLADRVLKEGVKIYLAPAPRAPSAARSCARWRSSTPISSS